MARSCKPSAFDVRDYTSSPRPSPPRDRGGEGEYKRRFLPGERRSRSRKPGLGELRQLPPVPCYFMIHPTAVVHPCAQLDPTVEVGPCAVIDAHVVVGPHCRIGPHVYLTGHTTIGEHNEFHAGCVIGDAPQDLKYRNEPTRLRIGDHNCFREHVTIHRSNKTSEDSIIGSHNLVMAHAHAGHNVYMGNYVVMANGAMLGGHVAVGDRAFISGNCLVHQFVRVGSVALMQGGSAISKDLPPYTIARGDNGICGLNVVGLRRAGFTSEERLELKRLYQMVLRNGLKMSAALEKARQHFNSPATKVFIEFIASSKRGVLRPNPGTFLEEDGDE